MRLTQHSDYALRVLMHLGLARDRLVTAEEIADAFGLSKNHLMKVVQGLARARFIETLRGRSGGLRLRKEPAAIRIGDVIRGMGEDLCLVECMGPENTCLISKACQLRPIFQEALEAYMSVLDNYTLADLLIRPAPLARLLSIPLSASPTRAP